jgi:hypothetical protein
MLSQKGKLTSKLYNVLKEPIKSKSTSRKTACSQVSSPHQLPFQYGFKSQFNDILTKKKEKPKRLTNDEKEFINLNFKRAVSTDRKEAQQTSSFKAISRNALMEKCQTQSPGVGKYIPNYDYLI